VTRQKRTRSTATLPRPTTLALDLTFAGGDPADHLALALGAGALVGGLDEVGRGPLAGPVVAACVVLPDDHGLVGLDDSKKLDEAARELLAPRIHAVALACGVAFVEPARIDELNILHASLEAMRLAFEHCERVLGREIAGAVVDGNMKAPLPPRVSQRTVVGGDGLSLPIMAASIVAKVARDQRMVAEAARFPAYGFEKHKGYPTPAHKLALRTHGPCVLHRRSFAPVQEALLLHAERQV
jgi:ribonuclease HII